LGTNFTSQMTHQAQLAKREYDTIVCI